MEGAVLLSIEYGQRMEKSMKFFARPVLKEITVGTRRKLLLAVVIAISNFASAQQSAATPRGISDRGRERLVKLIRHELVMLPYYGVFDNFSFRLDGGRVTLLGQVATPTLKTAAERAVKSIEGVEAVDNQIEVFPLSPNDDRIRMAIYRAIYSQPALQRYGLQAVPPIHILVKNGNVMLEGVVANEGDKNIANIQARGVSGVFNVVDHLHTDAELRLPNP
jgi:hyperosmotically inducible protein